MYAVHTSTYRGKFVGVKASGFESEEQAEEYLHEMAEQGHLDLDNFCYSVVPE